jgi:hypothetical protein
MKRTLICIGLVAAVSTALAIDPRLGSVSPPGVQAGTEVELRFNGSRLDDAEEILFYKKGFQVLKIEEVKGNFVRAKVKVAADCPLGEHPVRVRTKGGVTELRTFYVGPFPVVARVKPKAGEPHQKLPLNSTIASSVPNESQEIFTVDAKKGQRLSAEIESMRLGRGFYDPYIEILDTKGFILSRSDDTKLFIQDCYASAIVPLDGTYTIKVRETSYGSIGLYRMHVGTFARPTAVYPGGGQVGQKLNVKFIDPACGDFEQLLTMPEPISLTVTDGRMDMPGFKDFGVFATRDGVRTPSWNRLRISEFPNALEVEPNNSVKEATKVDAELPVALNGIIEKPGDEDWFRFMGKAGQTFDVRLYARKLRSPLDSVMNICNKDGGNLASNDDSGGPDSYVRFRVPSNGEFTLRVRDHLGNGGPDYVYRVEFQPVKPTLSTYIPDVGRYDTQTRKSIVVARGNRFPLVLNVRRGNFGGALNMAMKNFPVGIKLHCDEMASNKSTLTMVFEAAADAPIAGKLADVTGTLKTEAKNPLSGGIWQNYDLVQRGNNGVYYRTWVDQIAVTVIEELPFKIRIEVPKAPLVRDGTQRIKIIAERKEGFNSAINVRMLTRPPGLNCPSSISIPAGKNEAIYNFSANGSAEIKLHQIAMLGTCGVKGGTAYVSTQLTPLEFKEQFTSGAMPVAKTTQGYPTEVKVNLTQKVDFPGTATVELLGLPPGSKTTTVEMTKDTKLLTFPITTEVNARTGLHRTLFCRLTVSYNGTTLTQNFGGRGTLRVDPPPPPPAVRKPVAKEISKIPEPKPEKK